MQITSKITMDLQNPGVAPLLFAVQEDRYSRDLEITLTEGGRCWPIPEGASVLIRFRKSDGRGGEYDTLPDGSPAWRAEKNRLRVALAPQVLTMPGNVRLTITLLQGESRLSTFAISLRVDAAAGGEGILSEDYSHVTGFLPLPEKAAAGQILQVSAVDDRGRVTQLEAVDAPMGGGESFFNLQTLSVPTYTNLAKVYGLTPNAEFLNNGDVTAGTGYVTGYIPIRKGDILRIMDPAFPEIYSDVTVCLYDSGKTLKEGIPRNLNSIEAAHSSDNACGNLTREGQMAILDTSPVFYWFWSDFAWLRVRVFSPDAVITINEPLEKRMEERFVLKPEVKVTRESLDSDISAKPLSGKTIVGFGDSTFALVRDSSSVLSIVGERTGATVHNAAFGGTRMSIHPTTGYSAFSMWALAKAIAEQDWTTQDAQAALGADYFPEQLENLKAIDFSAVDTVVIHFGSNDFNDAPLDNADNPCDCASLCGAFRYSVETLLAAWPHLEVFVDLPTYRWWPDSGEYPDTHVNDLGLHLREYVDALRATAEEYNLPVIDCWHALGINRCNAAALLIDGAHHNEAGRKRLGELIAGQLR